MAWIPALAGMTMLGAAAFLPQNAVAQQPSPPADPPAADAKPKPKPKPKVKKPAPPPAAADAPTEKAKLLAKIKDWTVFTYDGADGRICFAASAPTDMQPKAAKRAPVIFYLTTWQKDGVRNEISVKLGHTLKSGSGNAVTVGGQTFAMITDDDKAFVKDVADERKLIAAMSGGGSMAVKSTPSKGATTTDQYSLDGLADALKKIQEACP